MNLDDAPGDGWRAVTAVLVGLLVVALLALALDVLLAWG